MRKKEGTLLHAPAKDLRSLGNFVIEIRSTSRGKLPPLPFEKIARQILGARYQLSLVVCGNSLSRTINIKYRHKRYIPNVLSFPLRTHEGEIFLNPHVAAREAKRFGVTFRARLTLLFVHGCLHLKGTRHGPEMEALEERMVKKFS